MSTATHISEAEYLRSTFEPDAEYVDGEVRERNVGTYDHSDWQQAILTWFLQHAKEWNIRSVPEQLMLVRPRRYRIPDVAVLDRANPKEQVVTAVPIAVFEVLSPEDRVQDLYEKLEDYLAMGIPHIWIIDPKTSIFKRYTDGSLIMLKRFEFNEREIAFDLSEIRALLQD